MLSLLESPDHPSMTDEMTGLANAGGGIMGISPPRNRFLLACAQTPGKVWSREKVAHHHERDKGVDALPLDGMLDGHHSGLGAARVLCQRALDLRSSNPVPRHIDDIIHTTCTHAPTKQSMCHSETHIP